MSPARPAGTVSIRLLLVLIVATALGPMAMQIFIPALPAIQERFGVSPATAQLTLSLPAFTIAFATLAYGPLSDRFAKRRCADCEAVWMAVTLQHRQRRQRLAEPLAREGVELAGELLVQDEHVDPVP